MKRLAVLIGAVMAAPGLSATEFNLGLNEHTIHTRFAAPISQPLQLNGSYSYNEDEGHLMDFGLAVRQNQGRHDFTLGAKYYRIWPDRDETANAIAVGGSFRSRLGEQFRIALQGYYAPSVLALDDLENLTQIDTRIEWLPSDNLALGLGYRYTNLDYKHRRDVDFDDELYLNLGFRF